MKPATQTQFGAMQSLLDTIPGRMFAVDRDYRYLAFNQAQTQRMLAQYGAKVAVGENFLDYINIPADREIAQRNLDRCLAGEQFAETARIVGPAHDRVVLTMRHIPIRNEAGEVVGASMISEDVSVLARAEDALFESNAHYRGLFENLGLPLLLIDPETASIIDANPAADKFYGYSHAELTAKTIYDLSALTPDETRQRGRKIAAGEITQMQTRHRLANGQVREVDVSLGRHVSGGKIVNIAVVSDISGQVQAEKKLRESEENYRLLAENSPDMIYVIDLAPYRTVYMNRETLLGYTRAELEAAGSIFSKVHPDDAGKVGCHWQNTIDGVEQDAVEYRLQARDGSWVWLSSREKAISHDKNGKAARILVTLSDITARKQAEIVLRESEERYRLLFDNMREGFSLNQVITDASGTACDARILAANAAYEEHIGLRPEAVIGKTILEVMPQTGLSQLEPYFKVAQTGKPVTQEYFSTAFQRYYRTQIFCPQPGQFATIVEDITRRKQAEDALLQSETKYSRMINSIHDFVFIMRGSDRTFLEANPAFCHLLGLNRDQIIWQSGKELQLWARPEKLEELEHRIRSGETVENFEAELRLPSGQIRMALISCQIIQYAGANCVLVSGRDITERKQAETALRASEERFRQVLENSLDVAYKRNLPTSEYDYLSPVFERISGYTPEEFKNLSMQAVLKLIHPDDLHQINAVIAESLSGAVGAAYQVEYRLRRKDGQYRWLLDKFTVLHDAQGQAIARIGSVSDVTEHKQAEEELRLFKTIIEASSEAIAVSDRDGKLVYINPAHEKLFGRTLEQAQNTPYRDFYPPESIDVLDTIVAPALGRGESWEGELDAFNAAGEMFPLWERADTIQNKDGSMHYAFGLMHDVGGQKAAKAALQAAHDELELRVQERTLELSQSIERLDLATGAAKMGIWDWNIQKNELVWDEQMYALYGVKLQDFGRAYEAWLNGVHPDDRQLGDEITQRALRGASAYDTEFRVLWPDGSIHWLKADGQVFWDEQGIPIRMLGANYDITERKQAEEKLAETNLSLKKALRARDEFMAAMSHELRTPLSGILGMAEVLQMPHYGALSEKQRKGVGIIQQSGQRLLTLVNDVLNYSMLQSSDIVLDLHRYSLNSICQVALENIESLAKQKNQQTHFVMTPPNISLQTDESQIHQVLRNLLNNASKFTPDGGEFGIEVTGDPAEQQVKLVVWDTGIGIAEEDFPRLFQPFRQLDASLARKYEGTGLGLVIVKKIVDLLGGRVGVESTYGKGCRFIVMLPWKDV